MQVLYFGHYNNRFSDVIGLIPSQTKTLLELCFADLKIAQYCKNQNIKWTGYDLNSGFVRRAISHGFEATKTDIRAMDFFPKSDVIVIMGSLYHFHSKIDILFEKMLDSADLIFISEPVLNMAGSDGVLGFMAKKLTSVGNGNESFRFNKSTLTGLLDRLRLTLNFEYKVQKTGKDMLIVIKKI